MASAAETFTISPPTGTEAGSFTVVLNMEAPSAGASPTEAVFSNLLYERITTEDIPLDKIPGSYVKKRSVDSEKDWEWNGYFVKLHEYLERYPVQKSTHDRSDAR